jgi:hypothetical protein
MRQGKNLQESLTMATINVEGSQEKLFKGAPMSDSTQQIERIPIRMEEWS